MGWTCQTSFMIFTCEVFEGCYPYVNGGAPAGWAQYSVAPGSDTLYYTGARLAGTFESIVAQCTAACLQQGKKYTRIAIHDSTACFCGINAATGTATSNTASSSCNNNVYRIRDPQALHAHIRSSGQKNMR